MNQINNVYFVSDTDYDTGLSAVVIIAENEKEAMQIAEKYGFFGSYNCIKISNNVKGYYNELAFIAKEELNETN